MSCSPWRLLHRALHGISGRLRARVKSRSLSLPFSNDKGKPFPSAAQGTVKIRFLFILWSAHCSKHSKEFSCKQITQARGQRTKIFFFSWLGNNSENVSAACAKKLRYCNAERLSLEAQGHSAQGHPLPALVLAVPSHHGLRRT